VSRYAEGTTVPVEKSRAEMVGTLGRFGVKKFGWDMQDDADLLFFEITGKSYRMEIVRPTSEDVSYNPRIDQKTLLDREWQRRWRANAMMLKMRLEFAESGDSTAEVELLPYLLLRDGTTLGQAVLGEKLPLMLAAGGK
jgi:hypothetical protein